MTIASAYAEFALREAHRVSPTYERLSLAISRDRELLTLLGRLPPAKVTAAHRAAFAEAVDRLPGH